MVFAESLLFQRLEWKCAGTARENNRENIALLGPHNRRGTGGRARGGKSGFAVRSEARDRQDFLNHYGDRATPSARASSAPLMPVL